MKALPPRCPVRQSGLRGFPCVGDPGGPLHAGGVVRIRRHAGTFDLGYIHPSGAREDFQHNWGGDDSCADHPPAADTTRGASRRPGGHEPPPWSAASSLVLRAALLCATRPGPPVANRPCRCARSPTGWRRCPCGRRTRRRKKSTFISGGERRSIGPGWASKKPVCTGAGVGRCCRRSESGGVFMIVISASHTGSTRRSMRW